MPEAAAARRAARRPWWKVVIVLLALLTAPVTIPFVLLLALFACHGISVDRFYARTPFVADLPGPTIPDQQRQFTERVASRFPIGMPADELERTLSAQGFTPSKPFGGYQTRLHVEHAIFPCLMEWDVFWTARDGRVTTVRGVMAASSCL